MLPIHLSTTTRSAIKILLFFIAIVVVQIKTPPVTNAQQSANNTAVFSGQFIPAFVGSAYDPTAAYQRMAGLPVYVFAYDSWGGASFIINNLAVRTQIRADGSFQAQGLPNGQKFGVYFPFKLKDDGTTVVRTDCDGSDDNDSAPTCQNTVLGKDVAFRMPAFDHNVDRIADVFSYNIADATALQSVRTQLDEPIRLGLTFLTQETRVDIENNINTFPLIPTNTLKITTKNFLFYSGLSTLSISEESAFEVVAERYLFDDGPDGSLIPGDGLRVAGRTTFPFEAQYNSSNRPRNDRLFQAYAPPGIYAVTVWRNERGTNYADYTATPSANGTSNPKLGSSRVGFGIIRVHPDGDRNGSVTEHANDWSKVLSVRNDIPILNSMFISWGIVRDTGGNVISPGLHAYIGLNVSLKTDTFANFDPKKRPAACGINGPWSYYDNTTIATCASDPTATGSTSNDFTNNVKDLVHSSSYSSYGTYAFYNTQDNSTPVNQLFNYRRSQAQAITMNPYPLATYNGPGSLEYEILPASNSQTFTTDGPIRNDLQLSTKDTTGVVINVSYQNSAGQINDFNSNPSSFFAKVTKKQNDEYEVRVDDGQVYYANALGRITIPHGDFVPLNVGEELFKGGHTPPTYIIEVGGYNLQAQSYELQYTGNRSETDITLSKLAYTKPQGYKLLGFIPANFLIPGLSEAIAADEANADFVINFKGAPPLQSLQYFDVEGNNIGRFEESLYMSADGSPQVGDWSLPLTLPYNNPETNCAGALFPRLCAAFTSKTNTVIVRATANEETIQQNVSIRPARNTGIATATPQRWDARFSTECDLMNTQLNDEFYKKHSGSAGGEDELGWQERIRIAVSNIGERVSEVTMPVWGCKAALGASSLLSSGLETFRSVLILEPLTVASGVISTWNVLRNIANVIFIFILLLIGINHALGYDIKNWGANILLPQLILGIIFANLSVLIVQGILDINNILTEWLFAVVFNVLQTDGIAPNAVAVGGAAAVSAGAWGVISTALSGAITGAITTIVGSGGTVLIVILGALLGLALTLLGLIIGLIGVFYGRYLIIWILTIVAPLIFALSVTPWFRSTRNLWWKTLLPVAFMQTVTAVFVAVGILLLTRSFDADSIFVQIGGVLIGGAALYMSLKSSSITAQFLGGGGLAGQAFGALQMGTKAISGALSKAGSSVTEHYSFDEIEERRQKGRIRSASAKGRDKRLEAEAAARGETYKKPIAERLPFGGTRISAARESFDRKRDKQLDEVNKAGMSSAKSLDYNLPSKGLGDETSVRGKLAYAGKALVGGQQHAAAEQQLRKRIHPNVAIAARTGLGVPQQKALRSAHDIAFADTARVTNYGKLPQYTAPGKLARSADGKVIYNTTDFVGTHEQYMHALRAQGAFSAPVASINTSSELAKNEEAHGAYMEAMALALKQNPAATGATATTPAAKSLRDLYMEGARYNKAFEAPPSP